MASPGGFDPFSVLTGLPGGFDFSGGAGPAVSESDQDVNTNFGTSTFISPPFNVVGPGAEYDGNTDQYAGGTTASPSQSAGGTSDDTVIIAALAAVAVVLIAVLAK